jgi:uncharacterized transporter YbjL
MAEDHGEKSDGPPVLALAIGVGTAIGTALGAATSSMGIWLSLGVGGGAIVGAALMFRIDKGS